MRIGMRGPARYLQEAGIRKETGAFAARLGRSVLAVASKRTVSELSEEIKSSFDPEKCRVTFLESAAGVIPAEIDRIARACKENECDVILGLGGGKILDNARAAADLGGVPLILMPTAASSDAACSAVAIIHNEEGAVTELREVRKNPDFVLADTELIAKAPPELLTAGIGDALSTWFEARASYTSRSGTRSGGPSSQTALTLSRLCFDILMEHAEKGLEAVQSGIVTDDLELLIHAVIYLSGLGSENGGTAAAHAVNDGFSDLPETKNVLHGKLVGYGLLVQLELEHEKQEMKDQIRSFMRKVGLPITLDQLGAGDFSEDQLWEISSVSCTVPVMKRMPFPVCPRDVYEAIGAAERESKEFLTGSR